MLANEWSDFPLGEWGLDLLRFDVENLDDDFSLPDGQKSDIQIMTFTVHKDQQETIEDAISIAKKMGEFTDTGNENSNGNAISRICELFISSQNK